MIIFLFHRLIWLIVRVFLLTLVSFCLTYYTKKASLRSLSPFDAYSHYFWSLIHGDLGISSINGMANSLQIVEVFPETIELCLLAFLVALLVGIPLGIISGMERGKWQDISISIFSMIGFSMPVFWLPLLLILYFSLYLDWLPVDGFCDSLYPVRHITDVVVLDAWLSDCFYRKAIIISILKHMILPIVSLAVAPTTTVVRLMRISTVEVMSQNYIRAAETRGLSRWTIIHRHLLHNALPPIIPQLGIQLSSMLTLAMITEVVFSLPGLGRWIIIAIQQKDYSAISAGVMLLGTLVIFINILSDVVGTLVNPLRYKEWYAIR
ncbi:putrescine export ABC transporter permease SapB [Candidatus Steffania adelgidicola]|uniref:putrescine export ABC transporter permease SapB n=1 Tax=Candidatus Steffania adelgidicola TaxID=1076626 RepID=UPI001D01BE82|nr:putrescine export ABC transporter permease SapB [Candidatus Steffania adelgidicola]UDG79518.1 Putrescine export system permease protein SapB [Candidatus Steffania adelgidicola]